MPVFGFDHFFVQQKMVIHRSKSPLGEGFIAGVFPERLAGAKAPAFLCESTKKTATPFNLSGGDMWT